MRREKTFFMLTLSSLPLVLLFLVLVLEVKIICSKEISSKDTEEEEHNRRETVANFPTFQNLQGFAQLNTSHAGRNDVYNSDRPDHPLPDSISTDSLYFYTCPFYSASQTSSATSDGTPKCMFYMNGGTQVTVTSCGESESGGYCSGDQYLRLTDAYGNQLASSDDACGDCSRLEYTSSWGSPASLLYIWQGCYSSNSCSGVVVIISSNILPSSISSSSPTATPTAVPISRTWSTYYFFTGSDYYYYCDYYSASNTSSATSYATTPQCYISAWGGHTISAGSCSSYSYGSVASYCSGNQVLRLLDSSGNEVARSSATCGGCAELTYTVPSNSSYLSYSIWEGCYSTGSCGGQVGIRVGVTNTSPTVAPSRKSSIAPTRKPSSAPTRKPSSAPSPRPSISPTAVPISRTTASYYGYIGSYYYYYCGYYAGSNTNSATSYATTPQCYISVCGGYSISLGSCSSYSYGYISSYCSGNQVLRLLDSSGNEVARSSTTCGGCAELTYTVPTYSSCQTYSIWEGCDSTGSCGGQVGIRMYVTTKSPTIAPSPRPSISPTAVPISRTTASYYGYIGSYYYYYCGYYAGSNTNSATSYATTPQCYISVCGGYSISLGSCSSYSYGYISSYCSGNQVLRLLDSSGNEVARSSTTCGGCAELTYAVPTYSSCQTYSIWEGCYSTGSCGGQVGIRMYVTTKSPTIAPSPRPSISPTAVPISRTTASYYGYIGSYYYYYCGYYAGSNTNSATSYATTPQCYISVCGGYSISLGSCSSYSYGYISSYCSGNQVLRLLDSSGNEVARSSTTCGGCAELTYAVPSYSSCQTYSIWEGCYSTGSCGGQVGIRMYVTTKSPTIAPSPRPSISPTAVPISRTTASYYGYIGSYYYYYCGYYAGSNTNSATSYATTPQCYISVCGGYSISLGSCSSYSYGYISSYCSGNQVLRLLDSSGNEVARSSTTCGGCAELTYAVPTYSSCQTYSIWEGCYSTGSCGGQVGIRMYVTTKSPTIAPSPRPSISPTAVPISRTTASYYGYIGSYYYYYCGYYAGSNTNSATSYATTPQCYISVCGGYSISLGSCSSYSYGYISSYCSGNQVLRLLDSSGNEVARSSTTCGGCAELTYAVPTYSSCQTYSIWEGCYSTGSCGGQVGIRMYVTTKSPTIAPSPRPSISPTAVPISRTTASYYGYIGSYYYYYCGYYAGSNTNSATSYATTPQCYISVCGGYSISLGSCSSYSYGYISSYCSGNQVLRLLDSSGNEVARSSTTCGGCAELTYAVPSYSSCQAYSIWEGCYSTGSCGGQVGIRMYVTTKSPTIAPTPSPSPSPRPSRRFTRSPTMAPSADALTKLVFTLSVSVQDGYSRSDDLAQSIWVQSLADVLGIPSSEVTFISISTFDSTSSRTDAVRLADGNAAVTLQVNMMLSDLSLPYGATLDDALDEVNSDISWLESSSGLQSLQNTLISVANSVGDSSFSVSVTDLQCSTVVISTPVDGNDDDGDGGDGGSMDVVFYVLVVLVPIVGVSVLCMLCWWLWHKYGNGSSSPPVVVGDQQQDVSSQAAAGSNNNNNNNGNIDQNMARDLESAPVVALELVTIQPGAEGNLSTGVMVLAIPIDILPDHKLPSAPPLP